MVDTGAIPPHLRRSCEELADRVRNARKITVLTGAGVSVASGVPTFRGAQGVWKDFKPEEIATPEAFARNPLRVWEWYDERRGNLLTILPNCGHRVLASWSHRFPGFTLITQNVDGLHERAETREVIRLHGSLREVGCWDQCPGSPYRWVDDTIPFPELPPRCPYCGGLLRPGVVWFGEFLDPAVWARAESALECDLFLSIGTSSLVYPAAQLIHDARRGGAFAVEINPDPSEGSTHLDLAIQGKSEEVLEWVDGILRTPSSK